MALLTTAACVAVPPAPPYADPSAAAPHINEVYINEVDMERRVLREVNRARQAKGRAALLPDTSLAHVARAHSRAMLERGFFAHRDHGGLRAGDRARRAGYAFHRLGENLFRGRLYDTINTTKRGGRTTTTYLWSTPDDLAALVAESWMESPGHRENMLSAAYDLAGVGLAIGPEFEVFVTLNLAAP